MEVTVKIPENLNIAEVLKASGKEATPKQIDKIAFICSSLHNSAANRRDDFKHGNRPYYPLYSVILRKYVQDYNKVLAQLVDLGVIETDGRYIVGEKSTGYRFSEKYFGVRFIRHPITDHPLHQSLQAYIKESSIKLYKDSTNDNPEIAGKYSFLIKFWKKGKLNIDKSAALDWVNKISDYILLKLSKDYWKEYLRGDPTETIVAEEKKVKDNRELLITLIERFDSEEYYFRIGSTGHRLYTNLTSIKREVRNYITYDGEKLVAFDIKNSSLFFLLAILDEDFWIHRERTPKDLLNLQRIDVDGVKDKVIGDVISSIMLLKTGEMTTGKGFHEIDRFTNLVTNGLFYDDLLKAYNSYAKLHGKHKMTRAKVKRVTQAYINREPSTGGFGDFYDFLYSRYPNIFKVINTIKHKDHKLISKIMQRVESYLIIEVICKRISKANKQIPLFTIHDSITTTEQYANTVQKIMIEELERFIGFKPPIKKEIWQSTNPVYSYNDIEFTYGFPDDYKLTDEDLAAMVG